MSRMSAFSFGKVSFERAYAESSAPILECSVKGCVNYTTELRNGKPMCERCMEEVEALERMYEQERFNKEFKASVDDWERRHVRLAKVPWTVADRVCALVVVVGLSCIGYAFAPMILEWFGIGVR